VVPKFGFSLICGATSVAISSWRLWTRKAVSAPAVTPSLGLAATTGSGMVITFTGSGIAAVVTGGGNRSFGTREVHPASMMPASTAGTFRKNRIRAMSPAQSGLVMLNLSNRYCSVL
jgi:hypothetical protein